MEQRKRRRPSAEVRRAIMTRFAESGLAVEAFCRRESISVSSFYRWRALRGSSSTRAIVARGASSASSSAAEFVALGTLQASHTPLELRLDLGGGVWLHLVRR